MTQTSEEWFAAVAKVGSQVDGIKGVIAGATAGQTGLSPMDDDLSSGLPAMVIGYGGAPVSAASWERQVHTLDAAIWVERNPLGERYAQLVGFIDAVMAVFPQKAKPHAAIASVLVTKFERIVRREWPAGSGVVYLTLPFSIEVVRNRAAQYVAAGP
jgi:hypothetical protein